MLLIGTITTSCHQMHHQEKHFKNTESVGKGNSNFEGKCLFNITVCSTK